MIVLSPLVLVGAAVLLLKSRQRGLGVRGWVWSAAWAVAGGFLGASIITRAGADVLLFAVGSLAVFWLAVTAPYWRELAGFPVGIAAVLVAAALI
jgi:hypothetical protein